MKEMAVAALKAKIKVCLFDQYGTRSFRSTSTGLAAEMVRVVPCSSGKEVCCVMRMPFSVQLTSDEM